MTIPAKLHFIWLGSYPVTMYLQNFLLWHTNNNDHEANLWIDSKTLKPSELEKLRQWVDEKNEKRKNEIKDTPGIKQNTKPIRLRDLNVSDKEFYEKMKNKKWFDLEMGGDGKNYAAAADILRTEFLFTEGGKYFDIGDIECGKTPLADLDSEYGFCCHRRWENNEFIDSKIVNDALASEEQGEIISLYRDQISKNYETLYENPRAVKAHRNSLFFLPGLLDRLSSTVEISGPGALIDAIFQFEKKKSAKCSTEEEDALVTKISKGTTFSDAYFKAYDQSHDWVDLDKESDDKQIYYAKIMRNHTCFYLSKEIDKLVIPSGNPELVSLLNQINKCFLDHAFDWSMLDIFEECQTYLNEKKLDSNSIELIKPFLEKFKTVSESLETNFFNFANNYLGGRKGILNILDNLKLDEDHSEINKNKINFMSFFEMLLFKSKGKPSESELNQFEVRLQGGTVGFFTPSVEKTKSAHRKPDSNQFFSGSTTEANEKADTKPTPKSQHNT